MIYLSISYLCAHGRGNSRKRWQSGQGCGKLVLTYPGGADMRFWPCWIVYGPWAYAEILLHNTVAEGRLCS
jgi:hypothetical protein